MASPRTNQDLQAVCQSQWTFWFGSILVVGICFEGGCTSQDRDESFAANPSASQDASHFYPVTIRSPHELKRVDSGLNDRTGAAVAVACQTCHATRPANKQNRDLSDLDQFHQGLTINHGRLTCVACHDDRDSYSSLHLADGTGIPIADSMKLCAQCHGPQFRDYEHGSHGGMNGYWDLARGPRERNHCLHCHDPHSPQILVVRPVAGPRDRFSPAAHEDRHE